MLIVAGDVDRSDVCKLMEQRLGPIVDGAGSTSDGRAG